MQELVPVILGTGLGVLIALRHTGRKRSIFMAAAIVVSALAATVLTREYRGSWPYLLPDLFEAALGIAFGLLLVRRLYPMPR